nr:hypothetical protein [Tanacetum cinerariifolium]
MYPEYIPLEDEHVLPAEEQPLPPIVSPTAESPEYVAELDPEEDPEEYEDDETEDGLVDYPMDGGDDGDDDNNESSGDDADDEDEDEEDEEEEKHFVPADSTIVIPTNELVSPPKGTEHIIPPPSTNTTTTGARITVRLQAAISLPPEAKVERLLAMPTPPPSPLASLSPPSTREHWLGARPHLHALSDAITATLPSPPLQPPLYLPLPIDRRNDIPEIEMPPRKRLCLSTLVSRYEIKKSSTARPTRYRVIDYGFVSTLDAEERRRGIGEVGYGIKDTWVDPSKTVHVIAPMTMGEVNIRVTELAKLHEHDTQDLYALLEDAHDKTLRKMGDMRRKMGDLQAELLALREQLRRARQPGGDARFLVKFATYTLLNATLTWWNSYIRSLGPDAYSMNWEVLKKKITDKYCLQGEIKKLEIELWNLKVKGNNVLAYTEHFQELTLICTKFVANETKKIDKYVSRLPDNIYGSMKDSKPKTLDETIELANDLMDQKLRTDVERQTNNKRKADDSFRNNHGHQQQPFKRQNVTKRNNGENLKGNGCFECGAPGHFKRDCPKLKNKDGGNVNAQAWVYAVRNAKKKRNASRDLDSNVVMGTFLLNNRYASILFDTGADRSFISNAFSSLIDIIPTP